MPIDFAHNKAVPRPDCSSKNMNILSSAEALDLLHKLRFDELLVHSTLRSVSGAQVRVSGLFTGGPDLVVVTSKDDSAYLSVPLSNRSWAPSFADKRKFDEATRSLSDKWQCNSCLTFSFDDGELLALIFDLP
jgi:hypothetical protein